MFPDGLHMVGILRKKFNAVARNKLPIKDPNHLAYICCANLIGCITHSDSHTFTSSIKVVENNCNEIIEMMIMMAKTEIIKKDDTEERSTEDNNMLGNLINEYIDKSEQISMSDNVVNEIGFTTIVSEVF